MRAALRSQNPSADVRRSGSVEFVRCRVGCGGGHDVFGIEQHKMVEASGGVVTDLKRSWANGLPNSLARDERK